MNVCADNAMYNKIIFSKSMFFHLLLKYFVACHVVLKKTSESPNFPFSVDSLF